MKRSKPIRPFNLAMTALAMLWFGLFIFGAPFLAAWFHGVERATSDQIELVQLIIALPIALPLVLFYLWTKWDDRRRHRAGVREALHGAKLVDSSRERRLDMEGKDVN